MPPKRGGGASGQSAYERQQQREKNKVNAEKRAAKSLEEAEAAKVRAADEKFKQDMAQQPMAFRLNAAAVKYLDKLFRVELDVKSICNLYSIGESSFYTTVKRLKDHRPRLATDAAVRAGGSSSHAASAAEKMFAAPPPRAAGGGAAASVQVRFQDDVLYVPVAEPLNEEAQQAAHQENLRQLRQLNALVDSSKKAAADHKASEEGKRAAAKKRKSFDSKQSTLDAAAKKARCDVTAFQSQMLASAFGADSLGATVAGRPAEFTEETIDAVKSHFQAIQTTCKNGVSQAAFVQMLLRYRQKLQSPSGGVLKPPSKSCLRDAVKRCDTATCIAQNAPDSRSRSLEDWRNALSCAGMWHGINDLKICPSLKFNIDDVGTYLGSGSRDRKGRVAHFQKGNLEEAIRRRLSPGIEETKHQPRMVYFSAMTSADGGLPATVCTVKDRQIPKGHVEMKQIVHGDRELFVCFAHPEYDKTLLAKLYLKRIFLPRIHREQRAVLEQLKGGSDAGGLDVSSQEFLNKQEHVAGVPNFLAAEVTAEALPKTILCFDGANEQIEPIIQGDIGRICNRMNISLFKFAAACSLVQQPNDVSTCHKALHKYVPPPLSLPLSHIAMHVLPKPRPPGHRRSNEVSLLQCCDEDVQVLTSNSANVQPFLCKSYRYFAYCV